MSALETLFLAPQYLWFLLLIPAVILLYILKLRRTEVIVSSTMLWLKSLQDLTANAPFQRLRKNLLLLLQIIVLLLVAFALARPFVRAEQNAGANIALVIDRSASMQTREDDGTRLDLAIREALDMVDAMAGGDKMMVISFADSAEVLCELTDDAYRVRRALESIEPSDSETKFRDVMMIVRSLAPDNPDVAAAVGNLEVVLFSDGNIGDRDEIGGRVIDMTYRKVGETSANAGIVGFSVRRPDEGDTEHQTFALVHNAASEPLETTLSLYFEDTLVAAEAIEVAPESGQEAVFQHPDFGEGILRVELDTDDALDVDNRAWLALRPPSRVSVLLVTEGESTSGYYFKRAFALEPRVDLSTVAPSAYAPTSDYDLVVFDGFSPDALPGGTLLFVNSLPPWPDIASSGTVAEPPILDVRSDHPAMRFINPRNVRVTEAMDLELPPGARTLISTRGGPLIADVSRNGQQILVVGFDISASNWPLRLSFPLFIQNVVLWTPRIAMAGAMSSSAGDPIPILPMPDVEQAEVRTPSGATTTVRLDPLRPAYFAATERAGVYTIARGESTERVAVNLLDRGESAVAPTDSIGFGRGTIEAAQGSGVQTRELWPWFIYGALAVLLFEWWVYSRRAWM